MIDSLLLAKALQAALNILTESGDTAANETVPQAPKSRTTVKRVRRGRRLVAPAGTADDLTSHRAKQLLRAHGLAEIAVDEDEDIK